MDPDGEQANRSRVQRLRTTGAVVMMTLVVAGATVAVYDERRTFTSTLHRLSPGSLLASLGFALVGVMATGAGWVEVVRGLGLSMTWRDGTRLFFTTQLGKYLPGSVWPALLQMQGGRAYGASRRTMLAANLITTALGCSTGLLVAALLLPVSDSRALTRYWWALMFLPLLLLLLHPRTIPALLDRILALFHRHPLGERLAVRQGVRASGFSFLSWLTLGGHLTVMCAALGRGGLSTYLLCTAAIALAVPLGVLFVPAPAGAGIRDLVLTLVLTTLVPTGQALAVVAASRVLMMGSDILLAAAAVIALRRRVTGPQAASRPPEDT